MNQSQLTPEQQALAFLLAKQTGQQPTSGGLSPTTQDPAAQIGVGQMDANTLQQLFGQRQAAPALEKQEGDKLHPTDAINQIGQMYAQKATGPQLSPGKTAGMYTTKVPVDQPLLRLLGVKKKVDLAGTNYLDTAMQAKIEKFLPSGLPRTPDGKPFVTKEAFVEALSAAQSFGPKTRADFFEHKGFDSATGMPVQRNAANGKFYIGDTEVPAKDVSRLLSNTMPNPGEKSAKDLADIESEKKSFQYAASLYKPEYVGPIKGSIQQTIDRYLESGDTDRATFYTTVQNSLINRLKRVSGGAVTPTEADRFAAAFFNVNKSPQSFEAALNFFINSNDQEAYNFAKNLQKFGYANVSAPKQAPSFGTNNISATPGSTSTKPSASKPKKALPGMVIH